MRTVGQMLRMMQAALVFPAIFMGYAFYKVGAINQDLARVSENRYISYLLADELRPSSDDLTRLARTYVVSGDPECEKQYFEILDIRNGKNARPNQYEKIYWDFRAAVTEPTHGTGETIPLQELMKKAGFTEAEFAKLREPQGNSDDLVNTETVAMNLVKGQLAQAGQFHDAREKILTVKTSMIDLLMHKETREQAKWDTADEKSAEGRKALSALKAPSGKEGPINEQKALMTAFLDTRDKELRDAIVAGNEPEAKRILTVVQKGALPQNHGAFGLARQIAPIEVLGINAGT